MLYSTKREKENPLPGRTFSRKFKLDIVRQIASGEKRVAQICREHSLAESLVNRWRKAVRERSAAAFSSQPVTEVERLQARITELERCCGRLALENELARKALPTSTSKDGI